MLRNKKYINYLKIHYKLLLKYQMTSKQSISSLLKNKFSIRYMDGITNSAKYQYYYKPIKSLSNLYKINTEKMDNLKIYIIGDDDYEYQASDINDIMEYLSSNSIDDTNISNIEYNKKTGPDGICRTIFIYINSSNKINDDCFDNDNFVPVSSMKTLEGFKNYTFTHGLEAYSCRDHIVDKVNDIINRNDKIHICCTWTNEFIGPVGLFIQGDCKIASHFDLHSDCNKHSGERYVSKRCLENKDWFIKSPAEITSCDVITGEAILTNINIVGLWVFEDYADDDAVKSLQKITGISEVTKIKKRSFN